MKINKEKAKLISIYGISHAVIDFCSAAVLFSLVGKVEIAELIKLVIIYNVLAFGMQSFLGIIADKTGKPQNYAITGSLSIILGIFLINNPIISIILIGLGNALFHVGGGIISLEMGNGRAKLPGLFVAPGTVGLSLGTIYGSLLESNILLLPFLLLCVIGLTTFVEPKKERQKEFIKDVKIPIYLLVVILILVSISIRSFVGLSYDFSGKESRFLVLFMVMAIAAGKASGGFIADKFGMCNTAIIGLLASIPLLKYGYNPFSAIAGMFFFNTTMPITLTILANMMPKRKGLAFGLTTMGLLVGFLPVIQEYKISQSMLYFEIILLSVLTTTIAIKLYEKMLKK